MGSRIVPRSATIRTRLARAYLEHKADLGLPWEDDAKIVANVDEITQVLFSASANALRNNDHHWLERYIWFAVIVDDLMEGALGVALDG